MASHLTLELDVTSPIIQIFAPNYTTRNIVTRITIQANEKLSDYQEVYTIDSNNTRRNYTFKQEENNKYEGLINFIEYPIGAVTIYAILRDEVDNPSNLASKTIELKEDIPLLRLEINDREMHISSITKIRRASMSNKSMKINVDINDKRRGGMS